MKKLKFLKSFLVAILLSTGSIFSQCYNIVGYMPSWVGTAAGIDYSKYTHINYAFGIPNSNGTIGSIENASKLSDIVSRAHSSGVKVFLAIGGWLTSSPSNTPFEAIANNSSYITTFVNSCANLVSQYNLDGIDIDWEYPTSQTKWNNIINPLATRIHSMGKQLSAAVPASSYYGNNIGNISVLDLVNIMAYDCACPTTAPYSQAVDALNYWAGRGVAKEKRMLGVPFYSEDNYTSLHIQKANLAKSNAGGIMIWDIATYWGDITAIYNTLGNVCGKGTTPPPSGAPVGSTIWLMGYNGKYVSSNNGTSAMMCDRTSPQGWEKFDVVNAGNGKVALRGSNGMYVSSENGAATGMFCNRASIAGWEQFDWISQGSGKVSLRGSNGQYVSQYANANGTGPLACNRSSAQGWEIFTWATTTKSGMDAEEITEITSEGLINVYPTIVLETINIVNNIDSKVELKIVDMSGKVVINKILVKGSNVITTKGLSNGMYLVKTISAGNTQINKIFIR